MPDPIILGTNALIQDVFERGLIPFMKPGYDAWKHMMTEMSNPYPAISKRIVFASDWEDFEAMKFKDTLEKARVFWLLKIIKNSFTGNSCSLVQLPT